MQRPLPSMGSEPLAAVREAASADPAITPAASQPGGEQRQLQIARLFELTSDLLATISLDGRFTLLNPAWEDVLGWSREKLLLRPVQELMHPDDVEQTLAVMRAGSRQQAQLENFTNRYRHRDGSWRWLLWSARCDGQTWYAAAKDVTDRMWLERQALHDPLTHLPNRLLLMDRTRQALARLHRSKGFVALLFVDLDRFKAVNDSFGHEVGDELLVAVSQRLAEMMRETDTVARLGGDEFVILGEEIEGEEEALALAERVLAALSEPFMLGSIEVSVPASVGVSVAHDPDSDPEGMLREADVAMYRAKAAGGDRPELFDEGLRQEITARLEIEAKLLHALPREELALAYQPIVPLAGGRAVGCEALVRWYPDGGDGGSPDELLPAAFLAHTRDNDLIVQIGEWVLRSACAQGAAWHGAGVPVRVSVNVAARQLTDRDLAEQVRSELRRSRLPAHALCLEVSEETVLRDPERARATLAELKRVGVAIALDNFGSRESSLSLPRNLPLDMLKLDRRLIAEFERDRETRAVVAAIIALAEEARLSVVAVGIETTAQLVLARELGCKLGQGFLMHRPESPEQLRFKDTSLAVTSAPWRPRVRLGGKSPRR